ncbi:glycosyltransferase family 2 protein [Edwardsiella tarda]|uniref:glycosyltransferase family 2 protein n=1 Tax=Edwardsiella tarda TaxID=636 RepID=UPI00351C6B07
MIEKDTLPLVTVIIPNYNNAVYLKESIDSVKRQTYKKIEILVVDDCSTDNSLEILSEIKLITPQLIVYVNSENKGVSFTRNQGVKYARGSYVTTLDPDDVYYPDKIEKEVELIRKHKGHSIVAYSGFNSVDENMRAMWLKTKLTKFNSVNGFVFRRLLYMSVPVPRDMLISKEQFFSVGGFNENMNLYEDWDFKLRLAKKYKFFFSGSYGVKYRRHKKGLSAVDFSKHSIVMKEIFLQYADLRRDSYSIFRVINGGRISQLLKFLLYIPIFNFLFRD